MPGFERSTKGGLFSVELRAPFATDAITTSTFDGSGFSNGTQTRFGNLTTYLKTLLYSTHNLAVSGGLGIAAPTASDSVVRYSDGTDLLRVRNDSVRLQPFLAGLYSPTDKLFFQGFVQYDVAANGNAVLINRSGSNLDYAGKLTDSSNLFVDLGVGYWMYKSNQTSGLTGIIPTLEIHQNSSLQAGDVVTLNSYQVGNFSGTTSLTNFVAGSTFEFGRKTNLAVAYTAPIGGGVDRQYNGGLQASLSTGW